MRSADSNNHSFRNYSFSLFLCVRVSLSLCYLCVCLLYLNSKNRDSKFDILDLYHTQMILETFYEAWANSLHIGAPKRIQIHFGQWTEFVVSAF